MALEQIAKEYAGELVVIGLAIIGTVWKVISMMFKLQGKVDHAHKRIDGIEQRTRSDHNELRQDIKDLSKKVDQSYDKILNKIDESRREATSHNGREG